MALPHLNDEEIRTWTPEQKDRWWLENVFRGNMPQLTIRAALTELVSTDGAQAGSVFGVGRVSCRNVWLRLVGIGF